jgi:hypothetical protein
MRKARKDTSTSTSYSEKHYATKLDLLTNATVVDGAIMFASFRNDDIKEIESKEDKNPKM